MLDVVKTKIANREEKRNFVEQHSCDFKKTNWDYWVVGDVATDIVIIAVNDLFSDVGEVF